MFALTINIHGTQITSQPMTEKEADIDMAILIKAGFDVKKHKI